jgi:hypothetical protein
MRDLGILFIHLLTTVVKLMGPGGSRAVIAESLLVKHQLVILNRGRERAPNLRPMDRVVAGLCALLVRPARFARVASPDHRIASLWANFVGGIPFPIPSQASALRANLEHVARGAEFRNFRFPVFWGRESETPRTRRVLSEPSPNRYPRESISFPTSRDRSVSVRDRVGFGLSSSGTNLLYILGFYNVPGNINSKIRVIRCFMFRDRLG